MLLARRPSPSLAAHVEMLWYCEGYHAAHPRERVLPNGRFQVIIDLAARCAALVVGMHTRYSVIETAALQSIMGIVFRPGGARAFLRSPAEEYWNRHVPLEADWGLSVVELRDRLREADKPAEKLRLLEAELERRADTGRLHGAVRQDWWSSRAPRTPGA